MNISNDNTIDKSKKLRTISNAVFDLVNSGKCYLYTSRYKSSNKKDTLAIFKEFEEVMKSKFSEVFYSTEFARVDNIWCYKIILK